MKKRKLFLLSFCLAFAVLLSGCGSDADANAVSSTASEANLTVEEIPAYTGSPYVEINGNTPYFTEDDYTEESFEQFSDLDDLGRCGAAMACVGQDLMPTEERGDISSVHPTGWQSVQYDFVDGESLYNRCHLIAYELTGENANEKNLITGTRYFNVTGMLPFENMVADYVKETDQHVLYRVTPIFTGENLVADGVLMEAASVEDEGEGVLYCVFCYNVEPGVVIDYATGDSYAEEETTQSEEPKEDEGTYILNTGSMKFHDPDCPGVKDISDHNRQSYSGSRAALIEEGYQPCGMCNP